MLPPTIRLLTIRGIFRMRTTRLGALIVALFTTLALTISLAPGSATAAPSPVAAAANNKPPHEFKQLSAGETAKEGRFYVKGQVTSYRKRPVTLQKQYKKGTPWRNFKKVESNKWGGFKFNFTGKIGNGFRVKLNGTPWRRATQRFVGRIVRGRTTAQRGIAG